MLQVTKLCGKLKIQLDERHYFMSSTLHNKIELFVDEKYCRDFTNLYNAFDFYWTKIEKDVK